MISVQFSVRPDQGDPSGFDLGDMALTGGLGSAGSVGHTPDQGMMIHLSVTLLLDNLAELMKTGAKLLDFTGIDTSFGISFREDRAGIITVSAENRPLTKVTQGELAGAVFAAAQELAAGSVLKLPERDSARADYFAALDGFRPLVERSA
ncbi:hypothetical protein [Streptomyces sp. NPDC020681]|uniref:hypothetical protein n=1 Tax=Streptomyces sp. NPDC020681 TaxID=3365083 RepID=UPI0037B508A2